MEELELIKWLGENCQCEMICEKNVCLYRWAFKEEAANLWDGINDEDLNWYTHEQILEFYKKSKNEIQ